MCFTSLQNKTETLIKIPVYGKIKPTANQDISHIKSCINRMYDTYTRQAHMHTFYTLVVFQFVAKRWRLQYVYCMSICMYIHHGVDRRYLNRDPFSLPSSPNFLSLMLLLALSLLSKREWDVNSIGQWQV